MITRYKTILLLSAILSAGAFLRFYKLGDLPLEGDNAYPVLAAFAIKAHGIPLMQSGELYLRAVPLAYLQALSVSIFPGMEIGFRVPNALFGILNILLVFLFCRVLSLETEIGIIASLLFAVSPMAVYFSRMPRMYETFLFAVLATWTCFYAWYFGRVRFYMPVLLFFSFLAITLHEAAIVPLVCYLTPIITDNRLSTRLAISISIFFIMAGLWTAYPKILQWLMLG